jgi:outer membrane protein assembly factor BamB
VVIASFGCFGQEDTSETVAWSDLTGTLVAFETDTGAEKWRFTFNGFDPTSSPAVSSRIAVISDSANSDYTVGTAYAIDVADGHELWRFAAHTGFISTPAIWEDYVFLVGANGDLFALNLLTGSELWRFKLGSRALQSPAVSDGVVYIGDTIASLFAIDATDGTELWSARPGQMSSSSPVVSANSVFIGGWGGFISRIDRATGAIDAYPIISGGRIFVTTDAGVVYALGDV